MTASVRSLPLPRRARGLVGRCLRGPVTAVTAVSGALAPRTPRFAPRIPRPLVRTPRGGALRGGALRRGRRVTVAAFPAMAGVLLAGLGWWGGAAPARAEHSHGGGSGTDAAYYRTAVTSVEPGVDGLDVSVLPDGQLITVTNRTGRTVVVLGYSGEPYLRLGSGGVEENAASVSALLNNATPSTPLPRSVTPAWQQTPRWRHLADGPSATWRDYRIRMTTTQRPPAIGEDPGRARTAFDWAVPLTVDGSAVLVRGTVRWSGQALAGNGTVPVLMLGGFVTLLATAAFTAARRRRRTRLPVPAAGPALTMPAVTMPAVGVILLALPGVAGPAPAEVHRHSGSCGVVIAAQPLGGGYLGTVLVFNRDRTMQPWRVSFELPDQVSVLAGWGAGIGRDGRTVIAESPPWHQLMRPGEQVSIGFVASGPVTRPGEVILNDVTCR